MKFCTFSRSFAAVGFLAIGYIASANTITQFNPISAGQATANTINSGALTANQAFSVPTVAATTGTLGSGSDFTAFLGTSETELSDATVSVTDNFDRASGVPEPATMAIVGLGLACLGLIGRKKKRSTL